MRCLAFALPLLVACSTSSSEPAPTNVERCATCHIDDFRKAPNHVGTRPDTCQICHLETAWSPPVSKHPWPLAGAHAKATCFTCHKGAPSTFPSTKKECVDCHRADYNKAPNHVAKKFPLQCAPCHDTMSFKNRIVP